MIKKILNSFKYAIEGIINAIKTERNLKIDIIIMILVIIAGIYYKLSTGEWIACIVLFAIVIAAELLNTSIETTVDMISPGENKNAKKAKDIAAGAVLIIAVGAAIIGMLIFIPKIF